MVWTAGRIDMLVYDATRSRRNAGGIPGDETGTFWRLPVHENRLAARTADR